MDNSVKVQLYVFFTLFYSGIIVGILFDIYRVIRYHIKPSKIKTFFGDLLFWILAVVIIFYFLIKSSFGELRGYIFIGLFLGVYLYIKTLSKIVYPLLIRLLKALFIVIKKFLNLIFLPLSIIKNIFNPLINNINKIIKISKQSIKDMKRYIKIISKKK